MSTLLNMGLGMYDLMAGKRGIKRHRHLSRQDVLRYAPTLVNERLTEGFLYYDAQTNDARLTMALIRTAAQYGVLIANYTEVTSFLLKNGHVYGARFHDALQNIDIDIQYQSEHDNSAPSQRELWRRSLHCS